MANVLLNFFLPRSPIDQSVDLHALVNNILHVCLLVITVIMLCVAYFLSQNKYGRALKMDAMRNVFKKSKRLKKSEQIFLSSMDAEERVEKVLREEGWGDVYLRRRVPVARVGHNREIDVIAVGPVVLVIEVKNWQGCIWSNGPRWFQKAFKRGKTLEFEDVQEDNVEKATAVRRYLENTRRVALPDETMRNEFVFQSPSANTAQGVKETRLPSQAVSSKDEENGTAVAEELEQDEEDEAALLAELHHEDGAVVDSATPPNDEEEDESFFARVQPANPSSPTKPESATQVRGTWYTDTRLHKRHGKCIIPIVVFTSPRVILDPATVKQKKYVFNMDTFRIFAREVLYGNVFTDAPNDIIQTHRTHKIRQWILQHRALRQWVPNWLLFPSSQKSSTDTCRDFLLDHDTRDKVCHAVDVLRTWDFVYLHNGRLITGDVVKLDVPSAPCSFERKHMLDIFMSWNTGYLGIVKTLLTNKAGMVEVALTTQKRLAKKKKEKKKRNAKGNVVFTLVPKQPKNIKASDHIEIKQAGSRSTNLIALADVKEIRLSHHLYDVETRIV